MLTLFLISISSGISLLPLPIAHNWSAAMLQVGPDFGQTLSRLARLKQGLRDSWLQSLNGLGYKELRVSEPSLRGYVPGAAPLWIIRLTHNISARLQIDGCAPPTTGVRHSLVEHPESASA
ncbi:MAG: hypothetical protein ACREDR_29920, partial [Blastocatellia bacterium]